MDFTLRPWRREDTGDLLRYANNEKIARNLRDVFPFPYILTDAQEFIESCLAADEEKQLFRAIEVDGHAVGSIALCLGSDVYRMTAELGYWLAEDFWGKGATASASGGGSMTPACTPCWWRICRTAACWTGAENEFWEA